MANLPLGSDIYKTVLSEIDNKYVKTMNWKQDSEDSDDSSMDEVSKSGKRNSYKLNRDGRSRQNKHRVQWIDECENQPLASDKRTESDAETHSRRKSILKYRVNCVIIVSE